MLPWGNAGTMGDCLCVKVIKKRKFASEVVLTQLRAEVTALKRLSAHPSILRALDDFENDQFLLIVMERALGGELFEQLVAHGKLTEIHAATLVGEVASGLEHCHQHGVIHRDLKPENLLLARANELSSGVKIADFGLAAISRDNAAKTFVGTPGYLAPEIRQQRVYDSKVDVWSLGVIVYIMLSGSMPFQQAAYPLSFEGDDCGPCRKPPPPVVVPKKAAAAAAAPTPTAKAPAPPGAPATTTTTPPGAVVPPSLIKKKRPAAAPPPPRPLRVLKADTVQFQNEAWRAISDPAKDFIWRCLAIQPDLRLTAIEALDHAWVQNKAGSTRVLSTKKLSKFVTARNEEPGHNASFFLEPNTVGGGLSSVAEKMQKAFRKSTSRPRLLSGRGYRTPDSSPTQSLHDMIDPASAASARALRAAMKHPPQSASTVKRPNRDDFTFSLKTKLSLERMASKGSMLSQDSSNSDLLPKGLDPPPMERAASTSEAIAPRAAETTLDLPATMDAGPVVSSLSLPLE